MVSCEIFMVGELSTGQWNFNALAQGFQYPPRNGENLGSLMELATFRGMNPAQIPGVLVPRSMLENIFGRSQEFSTKEASQHFQCCLRIDVTPDVSLNNIRQVVRLPVIGIYDDQQENNGNEVSIKLTRAAGDLVRLTGGQRDPKWLAHCAYRIIRYPIQMKDGYTSLPWFWPAVSRSQFA